MAETLRVEMTPNRIEVEPGAVPGEAVITVHNLGHVVDQYAVEVIGLDADWFTTPVSSVGLFPQDRDQLRISFHPPKRPGIRAASYPFRVIVRARGGGQEEAVDGVLDVRGFAVYRVDVTPRRQSGRKRGRYRLLFTNTGTADVRLSLEGSDPEEACQITFPKDDTPLVAAGSKTELPVAVQPRRRAWIGPERPYEFTIRARPEDARGDPQEVSGQFTHRPLFRSWSPFRRLAIILLVVAVVLVLADMAISTGVAGEFPRRVQVATGRVQGTVCQLPLIGRLCPSDAVAARPVAEEACIFEFGFGEFATAEEQLVGDCTTNAAYDGFGNGIQYTDAGVLFWAKESNTVYYFIADRLYAFVDGETRLLDAAIPIQ